MSTVAPGATSTGTGSRPLSNSTQRLRPSYQWFPSRNWSGCWGHAESPVLRTRTGMATVRPAGSCGGTSAVISAE